MTCDPQNWFPVFLPHGFSFPPSVAADPRVLWCHPGYGIRRLLPRQWNRLDVFPRGRQHPKHREEHPGSKLYCLCTHGGHQTPPQASCKTKPQLYNEQQLHDWLLLQSHISHGLPALQHHLLEYVCITHRQYNTVFWDVTWSLHSVHWWPQKPFRVSSTHEMFSHNPEQSAFTMNGCHLIDIYVFFHMPVL